MKLFALVLILVAAFGIPANALDETLLSAVPILIDGWDIVKTDYNVFLKSAREEINNLIENNHARVISRIGFATQDMKDSENDARLEILNRASDRSAECIQIAESELINATAAAGGVIASAARQLQNLNNGLVDYTIYQTIDQLDRSISIFDTEFSYLFSYFNSVLYLYNLLATFQIEVQFFFDIFDYFVEEVLLDMIVYHIATNQLNEAVFKTIAEGSEQFRIQSNSIVESLAVCN